MMQYDGMMKIRQCWIEYWNKQVKADEINQRKTPVKTKYVPDKIKNKIRLKCIKIKTFRLEMLHTEPTLKK